MAPNQAPKPVPSLMIKCEIKRRMERGDGTAWFNWEEVLVSEIIPTSRETVRCLYCKGKVGIVRQGANNPRVDHVRHTLDTDSQICPGGYLEGTQEQPMSTKPVN